MQPNPREMTQVQGHARCLENCKRANMATVSTTARESRRRKILDRGTDRLALITGRIQTLPSHSSDNPIADSSPPPPLSSNLSDQTAVSPNSKDGALGSLLPNHDPMTIDSGHAGSSVQPPPLPESGSSFEASRAPASVTTNLLSTLASSTDEQSTVSATGTERHLEPQTCQERVFTPNQISSAIASSESSRLFCSATIAFLVVLSYVGFPLLGSNKIKSIISLRPLYLVLLTNLTLVLTRLLFCNQRVVQRTVRAEYNSSSADGYVLATQASRAVEVGLLMQKAIDALFMDCSVYTMTVICGLSFV